MRVDDAEVLLVGYFESRFFQMDARTIHEDVNRSDIFLDVSHEGRHTCLIGDVEGTIGTIIAQLLLGLAELLFTTAYDEYALKAFDYNCIDYLLKPYREEALTRALEKCERILGRRAASDPASAQEPLSEWPGSQVTAALGRVYADLGAGRPVYRSRILLHKGQDEVVRETKDLCYAELDEGGVRVYFCDGEWADYPGSLGALSESLDPDRFQRISRQVILRLDQIDHLTPGPGRDTLVHLKAPYGTVSFTITADSKKRLLDGLRLIW